MESHVDLAPAVVIGDRYRLIEPMAQGGTSSVWRATDDRLARDVAVKILRDDDVDPALRERAEREAMVLAELSHPNIVRVLDRGVDGGRPFLVMDLLDGEPLDRVLDRRGALPVDEAVALVAAVGDGLGAAHHGGVVHRDVKPSNIVCVGDVPVLVDFGIARPLDATTLTRGLVIGTAAYLAPEQAQGEQVTPAADVYALGCVLYELLTGAPPFDGASPVAVAVRHVHDDPAPPSTFAPVPPAVSDVVIRCLAKSPEHRPADGAALADALRAASARGGDDATGPIGASLVTRTAVLPPVPATAAAPTRVERRRPTAAAIAAAVVGVVVVLALVLLLTAGDDTRRVPDVTDRPVTDAVTSLEIAGLAADITNVDADAPEGTVVATEPAPGEPIEPHGTVELRVSTGAGETAGGPATTAPPPTTTTAVTADDDDDGGADGGGGGRSGKPGRGRGRDG